jgi:hypothetical protein
MADFPLPSNVGVIKRVAGSNPAANNEVSVTVPTATNEVQSISGTPSATFALTVDGTTGPVSLSTTATAQNVQDYLNAFPQYSSGAGVVCTGGPLNSAITITYSGTGVAGRNVSAPTVAGGVTGLTITTTTEGTNAKYWGLFSVSVSLAQGATQTPWPCLVIDDGANIVFQAFSGTAAMNVSTTTQHTWAPGLAAFGAAATTANMGPLPSGFALGPGWRVRTLTTGIGANTDYAAPSLFICELG